jgi:hypothetical protein
VTKTITKISEQDNYNKFLSDALRKRLFSSGSDLSKLLSEQFGVTSDNARKILSRALTAKVILSSKPYSFGKGQYIYLYPGQEVDVEKIMAVCKEHRPPIYRLLQAMTSNGGIISYYDAMKITASTIAESSTKITTLKDILKMLSKLNITYELNDENNVNYILLKTSYGEVLEGSEASELMARQYSKMVVDCSLINDVIRWLTKSNLIDNSIVSYRNKKTPSIGIKHNNILWDVVSYTKTTGINPIVGAKADVLEKMTMVALDMVLSEPYAEYHLNGLYERVQMNIQSVKTGQRKILPIIIYKTCDTYVLNKAAKLGFLAFDISSIFGTNIYNILEQYGKINNPQHALDDDIDQTIKSILKKVRASGQEDALKDLKGVLFEVLFYPFLRALYPNAMIRQGKTLTMKNGLEKEYYEYDYIIESENPYELVLVELKGYNSSATISLGDYEKKASLKWFFNRTVPFAKKFYKENFGSDKPVKAVYITSANFYNDGREFIAKQNTSKLKSVNLETGYERKNLLDLLKSRGYQNEINIIEKFYTSDEE